MNILCQIGLHWEYEHGAGSSIHRYYQCVRCGRRRVKKSRIGHQPIREGWLKGGAWEDAAIRRANQRDRRP